MRVPGVMGSLGAGVGPQESLAIVVSPEVAIVRQAVSCCKLEEKQLHDRPASGPALGAWRSFFGFLLGASSDISQWPSGGTSLATITTVFWDIGGVVLTNGWDHNSRMEAAQTFQLDWEEYRERHDLSFPAFDAGQK